MRNRRKRVDDNGGHRAILPLPTRWRDKMPSPNRQERVHWPRPLPSSRKHGTRRNT